MTQRHVLQLRQNMTDAERRLWTHLRAHRLTGAKFRRQQPIGRYIVDFVCFESRLIVEADGSQHLESAADLERDAWLASQGYRILRFWNNDILNNTGAVLQSIAEMIAPSPPTPLPPGERGYRRDTHTLPSPLAGGRPGPKIPPTHTGEEPGPKISPPPWRGRGRGRGGKQP